MSSSYTNFGLKVEQVSLSVKRLQRCKYDRIYWYDLGVLPLVFGEERGVSKFLKPQPKFPKPEPKFVELVLKFAEVVLKFPLFFLKFVKVNLSSGYLDFATTKVG